MLTPKMNGLFDVREYDGKTKEHNARRMKADTDNIVFSVLYAKEELPEQFKIGGQPDPMLAERASRKEREDAQRENRQPRLDLYVAKFKVGQNARWFDKYGRQSARPTNAELETERWQVQIDFSRKDKDPQNPLKPSGYWVNAIMIAKIEDNPFSGQAFEVEPEVDSEENTAEEELPFN